MKTTTSAVVLWILTGCQFVVLYVPSLVSNYWNKMWLKFIQEMISLWIFSEKFRKQAACLSSLKTDESSASGAFIQFTTIHNGEQFYDPVTSKVILLYAQSWCPYSKQIPPELFQTTMSEVKFMDWLCEVTVRRPSMHLAMADTPKHKQKYHPGLVTVLREWLDILGKYIMLISFFAES